MLSLKLFVQPLNPSSAERIVCAKNNSEDELTHIGHLKA